LLQNFPSAVEVIRSFASFVRAVKGNLQVSDTLLAYADETEADLAREKSRQYEIDHNGYTNNTSHLNSARSTPRPSYFASPGEPSPVQFQSQPTNHEISSTLKRMTTVFKSSPPPCKSKKFSVTSVGSFTRDSYPEHYHGKNRVGRGGGQHTGTRAFI